MLCVSCGYMEESNFLESLNEPGRSSEPWWDEAWEYRRILTIDNSGQGTALANFPVLVRLNSSRINYNSVQNNGEDLRFIDNDGTTELDYEIEIWNESGESIVWIEVPQVDASSATDYIVMYYGNNTAPAGENAQGVWDNNFEFVWHMGEQPGGSGDIRDSTANNMDGSTLNMEAADRTGGFMGYGLDLDGTDEWIDPVDNGNGIFHDTFTIKTVEICFRADNTANDQSLFDEGGSTNGFWIGLNSNAVRVDSRDSSSQITVSSAFTDTSNFYYIVGKFDNGTLYKYVNGLEQSAATGYSGGEISSHSGMPGFGASADSDGAGHSVAGYYFNGILDEIRFSSSARSSDWIQAQSMSLNGTYITFGSEED